MRSGAGLDASQKGMSGLVGNKGIRSIACMAQAAITGLNTLQTEILAKAVGVQVGDGWLVTDLKQALDEDQVVFGTEEINSTLDGVIAYTSGARSESQSPPLA